MEFAERWTRIGTDDGDFFDVLESYNDLLKYIEDNNITFLHLNAVSGYRVSLKKSSIISIMEGGFDIMDTVWEFGKAQEDRKKQVEMRHPSWE